MFENEGQSCWSATAHLPAFPSLDRSIDVDAAIIGGGITGITTAYLLKQCGLRVALLERGRCGGGQTGRSTAHLTTVPDLSLATMVERIGLDGARALWEASFAAIARIRAEVRDSRINCEFAWVRGCLHAAADDHDRHRRTLTEEAVVAHSLAIDASYADHIAGLGGPGVWFDGQARLHPLRYLTVLLEQIDGDGSLVAEQAGIDRLDPGRRELHGGGHVVRAPFIVCATHEPIDDVFAHAPHLRQALLRLTTYVVSGTAPAGALDEGLYWEHRDSPYEYLRVDRTGHDDVVIFGGVDHAGGSTAAAADRFARLERRLHQRVPTARVEHRWSGTIVESIDGRPCIGEVCPGVFVATGFGGNGMTYGTMAAMIAVEAARGGANPWWRLVDPRRFAGRDEGDSASSPARHVPGRSAHATVA